MLSLAVSPDGQQLYAGTADRGVFASQDRGRTWVNTYPDHYVPNLVFNPANPAQAVASLRDQLVRTQDGGQSWHTLPVAWAQEWDYLTIMAGKWRPGGWYRAGPALPQPGWRGVLG